MHIDYLATVEKMLALPVERLVGKSSSTTSSSSCPRRMSLSPDSSNSGSIISSSSSINSSEAGESAAGKCSHNHYCPKISSCPNSPNPDLQLQHNNNNNNNNDEDSGTEKIRIKIESPEEEVTTTGHHNRFPINNRKSGEEDNNKDVNHSSSHNHTRSAFMSILRPSAQNKSHKRSNNNSHNNNNGKDHHHDDTDDDDEGDIDVDGDDDNNKSCNKTTSTTNPTTTTTGPPVSSVNTSSSSSPLNFKPLFSISNFGLNLSHHHHHNHHDSSGSPPKIDDKQSPTTQNSTAASLKFSIEDILRPDFGLTKFQLLAQQHHHHQVQIKRARISGPISGSGCGRGGGNSSSVSSTEGHRPYKPGPGSVIYHSEDSNGSCASSSRNREPEVVDDTKVNPAVPEGPLLWPAWVYCTRYSDRPSSGPRSRRIRKSPREIPEEKRPRTAFTGEQLSKLKKEFDENRYLTEKRRQDLARDLKLHENQIKIWFQNKRAKLKKSTGTKNGLAMQLMAQGLYNHSTVPVDEDDEMMMEMM